MAELFDDDGDTDFAVTGVATRADSLDDNLERQLADRNMIAPL